MVMYLQQHDAMWHAGSVQQVDDSAVLIDGPRRHRGVDATDFRNAPSVQ